jgi:hypothetical protein
MRDNSFPGKRDSWVSVTRSQPCPICNHVEWCRVSADGKLAACRRNETGSYKTSTDKNGAPVYLHRLTGDAARPPIDLPTKGASIQRADADTLHRVYEALLCFLTLSEHKPALYRRGLKKLEFDNRLYGSLPGKPRANAAARSLEERFGADVLISVPGFITKKKNGSNYITIAGSPGLLIPVTVLSVISL